MMISFCTLLVVNMIVRVDTEINCDLLNFQSATANVNTGYVANAQLSNEIYIVFN